MDAKKIICLFAIFSIFISMTIASGTSDKEAKSNDDNINVHDNAKEDDEKIEHFTGSYFTGDGGAGIKLQIDELKLSNMDEHFAWLPEFAINTVSDDIAKYSNIEVIDTHNISRVENALLQDESAVYSEEDAIEVGNFSVARYIMLMTITGKGNNCAFSVRINDKEHNTVAASYSNPNCKISDLETSKALKEAVVDLLGQMNVKLTDSGKKAMLAVNNTENTATINAQKNVAQGVVAMNSGSELEAISYFIKARSSDKTLARIDRQLNQSFDVVTSNDFAAKARNLIEVRKAFLKIIEDLKNEFEKNPPFVIVFEPQAEADTNKINYEKETVPVTVVTSIYGLHDTAMMLNRILAAIRKYPEWKNWGAEITNFPYSTFPRVDNYGNILYGLIKNVKVPFIVTDSKGKELGSTVLDLGNIYLTNVYNVTGNYGYYSDDAIMHRTNGLGLLAEYRKAEVYISANSDTSHFTVQSDKPYYEDAVTYREKGTMKPFNVDVITVQEYAENYLDFPFSFAKIEGTNLQALYYDPGMNGSFDNGNGTNVSAALRRKINYIEYYNQKCSFVNRPDLMIANVSDNLVYGRKINILSTSPNTESICSFYSKNNQKIVPVSTLSESDAKAFSNFINSVYTPRVSNYSHSYPNVYFSDIVVVSD